MYKNFIKNISKNTRKEQPVAASVVIVTYDGRIDALKECLEGLLHQGRNDFETVIVENGSQIYKSNEYALQRTTHIELCQNYGLAIARNIGAHYSNSDYLIFLDDDGIPDKDFVASHLAVHEQYEIFGARGRCMPKTALHNEYISGSYDIGTEIIPAPLNLEGNCSVKTSEFVKIGGWKAPLYAHQGLVLTYELTKSGRFLERTIYTPNAIVYHDNAKTLRRSLHLSFVRGRNTFRFEQLYPDLQSLNKRYNQYLPVSRKDKSLLEKLKPRNVLDVLIYRLHDGYTLAGRSYEWLRRLTADPDDISPMDTSETDGRVCA